MGIYTDHYPEFGNQHVMACKLLFDFSLYWGINALRFVNGKFADIGFTQALLPQFAILFPLTARVQQLFKDWHRLAPAEQRPAFVSTGSLHLLHDKQLALDTPVTDDEQLKAMFAANTQFQQALAVLIFHEALRSALPEVAIDEHRPINPVAIGLDPERWEADGLFDDSGLSLARAREIAPGIEEHWLGERTATA